MEKYKKITDETTMTTKATTLTTRTSTYIINEPKERAAHSSAQQKTVTGHFSNAFVTGSGS